MIKVKIYKAEKYISPEFILNRLESNLYDEAKGYGFHIINNDDLLEIQFTLRSVNKQTVEYANGDQSDIEIATYLNVNFGIRFGKKIVLYAINPPVSMKYPYTMVHKLFGEDSGLKPLDLNLKDIICGLSELYDLKVKSISLSNIQLDAYTLSKTKIVSSKDVAGIYRDEYMDTPAVLDSAHFFVNGIEAELTRTGRFRVRQNQLATLLTMLESV